MRRLLDARGVPRESYRIFRIGVNPPEDVAVFHVGFMEYQLYAIERGKKHLEARYRSKNDACHHFVTWLTNEPVVETR